MVLPEYQGDPVVLAGRVLPDVRVTRSGALFRPPVEVEQAVPYVLDDVRDAIGLDALQIRLDEVFAGFGPALPTPHALAGLLTDTAWKVDGDRVVRRDATPPAPPRAPGDDPRDLLAIDVTVDPKKRVVDVLQQAGHGGSAFRLVVAPPESHRVIGESLVRALGAVGVNLTDAWFARHAVTLDKDARAARLVALRAVTAERVNRLFDELVAEHGAPGATVVVYDTGLLEVLGGLEQVRLLYDRVAGRGAGFWILVVPGVVHQRQPLFNDRTEIWHQPGLVLPLNEPL